MWVLDFGYFYFVPPTYKDFGYDYFNLRKFIFIIS